MPASPLQIRADFDRLALLYRDQWNNNRHYHGFLLRHAPLRMEAALDAGCGAGELTRALAQRAERVVGVDLSPNMIELARRLSAGLPNIDYRLDDLMTMDLPPAAFDCIASIATLHHLPLEAALRRLIAALKPGGVLLVLDLRQGDGWRDRLRAIPMFGAYLALRLIHNRTLMDPPEVRAAWNSHGQTDEYLTVREVRRICAGLLPGARITDHWLWRYSIVWIKP